MTGRPTQQLRVLQEDRGADAVAFENLEEGVTFLFINPDQSFDFAVNSVLKVCPELSLPQVQDLVRTHCPDIREMNERMGADQPPIPRVEAAPAAGAMLYASDKGAHRWQRPPRWARIVAVAAPALVGGTLLGQFFTPQGRSDSSEAGVTVSQPDTPSVFDDPTFKQYVEGGKLRCHSVGQYAAKCVDADGQVMVGEAGVGNSAVFTFSYGSEKVGFRVFSEASAAAAWAAEDGNRRLYEHMTVVGRVVLWGTDRQRLREWAESLERQKTAQPNTMGGMGEAVAGASRSLAALPKRLAVLAFGTLGVTENVAQGLTAGSISGVRTQYAVELVMGVAAGEGSGIVPSGLTDAAAIAAGAQRPPAGSGKDGLDLHGSVGRLLERPAAVVPTRDAPPASEPEAEATAPSEPTSPAAEEPAPEPEAEATAPSEPTSPAAEEPAPEPEAQEPEKAAPEPEPEPKAELPPQAEHGQATTEAAHSNTTPAPPNEEEPEEDGLSMEGMPPAWAA